MGFRGQTMGFQGPAAGCGGQSMGVGAVSTGCGGMCAGPANAKGAPISAGIALLAVGCRLCLSPELEREWPAMELAPPGKEALGEVLNGILKSAGLKGVSGEKGLAGSKSSEATDGGTSARVLGAFLSWMAEKTSPVFVVATANDVTQLPPELLRAGRWDQMFFVDLPTGEERQALWKIQVAKHGRDAKDFDVVPLARASEGLTGSEIEAVFVEALYQGFDEDREPTDLTIAQGLTEFVPLSKTMAEQIVGLRTWARGRARLATTQVAESKLRRLAA